MITRWPALTPGLAALSFVVALLVTATPASGAIVINEVESDGAADFVELFNTGAAAVDIGGYVIDDDVDGNAFTVPGGTVIQSHGYYVAHDPVGLGGADSARLFAPGPGALLDSYSWTSHAIATYGRCPDGTGAFTWTNGPSASAANDCPAAALAWRGGSSISLVDDAGALGSNVSGLAYQPSGSGAKGVLWAVKNGPSLLFRLIYEGTRWTPDTASGWGSGKQLVYPDGDAARIPDAEGVTLVGGDPNGVYVATERDDSNGGVSRPAILRYDGSAGGATLTATREWNLTADLPGLDSNAGLEAITWVPDSVLVAKGFLDEATGVAYDPASYPGHGTGLFFVGVEQDGRILAYALNQTNGTFTRVASIASGFPRIMALEHEAETTNLWVACDDGCDGRTATLDIAQSGASDGRFVVTATYERPAGMANLNNEGFAIAPQAECVGSLKPVIWSDDGNTDSHALRGGTLSCTVPSLPAPPESPPLTPGTPPPSSPAADRTPPSLRIALRLTKSGTYAVRRTGRVGLVITLGEKADLTIRATVRRGARARPRTILRAARRGVAVGRRTLRLKLTPRVRRTLRKGEAMTIIVVAKDAAGNATTRRARARVR